MAEPSSSVARASVALDPTWIPDWLEEWKKVMLGLGSRGGDGPAPPPADSDDDGFERAECTVTVTPKANRTVHRKLNGIHLSMITVNAVLGTGLYWRGGQILELGGPLVVLLAFLIVGALAIAVMQCITEMLCIWPVPGALPLYVGEFVDPELGLAVGVAYWFTYSVSFAALVAVAAAEMDFWIQGNKLVDGLVVYGVIPIALVCLNLLPVKWFGHTEVFFATTKLVFYLIIVFALIAINQGAGSNGAMGNTLWGDVWAYDTLAAKNWGVALLMSLSFAAFAYVGVEIVAASALEARWPHKDDGPTEANGKERAETDLSQRSSAPLIIGSTVKFSAIWISVISMVVYVVGGVVAASDIERDDCRLPRLSWVRYGDSHCENSMTSSAFVIIALKAGLPRLADTFNVFLVYTALTCANTNLYVASRSLFGLTSRLDGGDFRAAARELLDRRWASRPDGTATGRHPLARALLAALAWVGRTNSYRIPRRAMLVSAAAFIWVPFLQLKPGDENGDTSTPIGMFIEILAQMGSVGVIIVWACECWAFIRFYDCIYRHRDLLKAKNIPQVRRWDDKANDYPYRSIGQPFTAWFGLVGCIFILVVCNGSLAWSNSNALPLLSAYLIMFVFAVLVVVLKLVRGASWRPVNLRDETMVLNKMQNLHDIRWGAR